MTPSGAPRIALLDYRMSNLHSAGKALERLGAAVTVVERDAPLAADAVVLPGVGAFGEATRRMAEQGLDRLVRAAVADGLPLLGICLGMQLLLERSEESPGAAGLGLLAGEVARLRTPLKLPDIGWREVSWRPGSSLAEGEDAYYFVHSYACVPADPAVIAGTASHGVEFCAAVAAGRITGVQFHPEKSSRAGLALLGRWLAGVRDGSAAGVA